MLLTTLLTIALSQSAATIKTVPTNPRLAYVFQELRKEGLSQTQIDQLFRSKELQLYQLKKIAYKPVNWPRFHKILLTEDSIQRGKKFKADNSEIITKVKKSYGVDESIIVSLIRIETNLGFNTGNYKAFNIFYTKVIRDPKEKWVNDAKHLIALSSYCAKENVDCFDIRSSYAGAIGLVQFLPLNLQKFARDGNGDGKIDLFNPADAIESAANFLVVHGWHENNRQALQEYYGSDPGYPKAVLLYAKAIENP